MQDFNYIKQQFLSLQIPINEHYLNRYIKFILSLSELKRKDEYCEKHHILPESLFPELRLAGTFPWNQKSISAKSHFICHWLLWKAIVSNKSMSCAFWSMCNQTKNPDPSFKINARAYAASRSDYAKIASARMKEFYSTDRGKSISRDNGTKGCSSRWENDRAGLLEQVRGIWTEDKKIAQSKLMKARQNRAWKHNNSDMTIWSKLDKFYEIWVNGNKPGFVRLGRLIGVLSDSKNKRIVEYFIKYGNPNMDIEWTTAFN